MMIAFLTLISIRSDWWRAVSANISNDSAEFHKWDLSIRQTNYGGIWNQSSRMLNVVDIDKKFIISRGIDLQNAQYLLEVYE